MHISISDNLKLLKNAFAVRSRPTLKDVGRFRNGSVRKFYQGSIYESTFISEPSIENHAICSKLSKVYECAEME